MLTDFDDIILGYAMLTVGKGYVIVREGSTCWGKILLMRTYYMGISIETNQRKETWYYLRQISQKFNSFAGNCNLLCYSLKLVLQPEFGLS
jgi:hypothetical protein